MLCSLVTGRAGRSLPAGAGLLAAAAATTASAAAGLHSHRTGGGDTVAGVATHEVHAVANLGAADRLGCLTRQGCRETGGFAAQVLPLMLVNGEVKVSFAYPTAEQIKRFSRAHLVAQPKANAAAAACGPSGSPGGVDDPEPERRTRRFRGNPGG